MSMSQLTRNFRAGSHESRWCSPDPQTCPINLLVSQMFAHLARVVTSGHWHLIRGGPFHVPQICDGWQTDTPLAQTPTRALQKVKIVYHQLPINHARMFQSFVSGQTLNLVSQRQMETFLLLLWPICLSSHSTVGNSVYKINSNKWSFSFVRLTTKAVCGEIKFKSKCFEEIRNEMWRENWQHLSA